MVPGTRTAITSRFCAGPRAAWDEALSADRPVILNCMTDPNVPAAVKLRAAECVFDRAIKGVELEDIEARVAELERAAEAAARKS